MSNDKPASIRQECWNQALRCFGTAYLFERRARRFRTMLRVLAFAGIAGPAIVGAVVLSFQTDASVLPIILVLAGVLSVAQLIASLWALSAKWDDAHAYASESTSANYRLFGRYRDLARIPPSDAADLERQFELLQAEYRNRSDQDNRQGVTDEEKRRGYRAALRELRRPCPECGNIPASMEPTDCGVCGNFRKGVK
jgi:mobilome CxxCx(11)CxxC protein